MKPVSPHTITPLGPADIDAVIALQQECVDSLADKQLYFPLTREEIAESLRLNEVTGVRIGSELAALSVVVANRTSERNLAAGSGFAPEETLTFDAVLVAPRWRGHGLQRILLHHAIATAQATPGIRRILATCSPLNLPSLNNFLSLNFQILSTTPKYSNLPRHTLLLPL